jgi:hypothetical protein
MNKCTRCHCNKPLDNYTFNPKKGINYKSCESCRINTTQYKRNKRLTSIDFKIKDKLSFYKHSDKIMNREFSLDFESAKQIYDDSKGICCYCKKSCELIKYKRYDKNQFTFDRINNDLGHTKTNCVISCLQCNLSKGRRNHYDFMIDVELYGN